MGNPVVRFEIAGRLGEALEAFYSELFGWRIERKMVGGSPYGSVRLEAHGDLSGGIRHEPEGGPEVALYVRVPDLDSTIAKAIELGEGSDPSPENASGYIRPLDRSRGEPVRIDPGKNLSSPPQGSLAGRIGRP